MRRRRPVVDTPRATILAGPAAPLDGHQEIPERDEQVTAGELAADVRSREGAAAAREETVALREEAASLREEAAGRREETSALGAEAVQAREDAAALREDASTLVLEVVRAREDAAHFREETSAAGLETVRAREDAAERREAAAAAGVDTVRVREYAAGRREDTLSLATAAIHAQTGAAHARSELEQLMRQIGEANERLVLCTVRAQTMTGDADEAESLKQQFLARVSHQFRTPLTAVMGWAQMLGTNHLPPDRARHAIATIERNALALAHAIDDLLDVFVPGPLHLAAQPIDLSIVIAAALDGVRPLAVIRNVRLAAPPDYPSGAPVRGDPIRLYQVFWNLLANAVTFTPQNGTVSVFVARVDDYVAIRIVDTGAGISPAFLPHVFERFRQADGTMTGLGLGLAIVHHFVELHGGSVHAASEGLGHGSTFTVRLRISEDAPP